VRKDGEAEDFSGDAEGAFCLHVVACSCLWDLLLRFTFL
jgi:hypothetical protein